MADSEFIRHLLALSDTESLKRLLDAIEKEEVRLVESKKKMELRLAELNNELQFLHFIVMLLDSLSAIVYSCIYGAVIAFDIFGPRTTSHQQCLESMTVPCGAADAVVYGLVCCSVLQAAAALMTLLFTGRHRQALAYTTVATTTAGHCTFARFLLAGNPGEDRISSNVLCPWLVVIIGLATDLFCFHLLIQVGRGDGEEEGVKQL